MPKPTIKNVKAWAVVPKNRRFESFGTSIVFNNVYNSFTHGVFPVEKNAQDYATICSKRMSLPCTVVPCTITYQIPNKKPHGKK